jgi:Ca2+-binding EF-hand superfamily protein
VFNDFDKSKKGYLIYKEFKEMAQKMVKEISDEDSVLAFKIIDVNNSQTISFSEMLDHFNRINGLGQIQ